MGIAIERMEEIRSLAPTTSWANMQLIAYKCIVGGPAQFAMTVVGMPTDDPDGTIYHPASTVVRSILRGGT